MSSGSPAASEGGVTVPKGRRLGCILCISVVAALGLVSGCAGRTAAVKTDPDTIRVELRRARTAEDRERLLQPRRLSSIGSVAKVSGVEPIPCTGIGLVTGLGQNGAEKSNIDRSLKDDVKKMLNVEEGRTLLEARDLLESRDSSIVQVDAEIPPGAAAGTPIDVYVRPIDSAISLQNGYLHKTALKDFAVTKTGEVIYRQTIARAEGAVAIAGTGPGSVVANQEGGRAGVVFDGARYEDERTLLVIVPKSRTAAATEVLIEYLVNQRFANTGRAPGTPPINYATAMPNSTVVVRIPSIYRRYVQRFADAIREIKGAYYYGAPPREQLEKMVARLSKGTTADKYQASVELEAVGAAAAPYLESALDKGDEWTALYAAQALSYLDNPRGAERICALAGSADESVRLEAVKFAGQLAGRRAVQVLRERLFDPSSRVALEAAGALVAAGGDAAARIRLSQFDIVAVPGTPGGLLVKTTGRPMIVVTGLGTRLTGSVAIHVAGIGIGSIDDEHVGIVTGEAPEIASMEVEASVDSILAALARINPPFDTARKVIQTLEDSGNIPYKITWLD